MTARSLRRDAPRLAVAVVLAASGLVAAGAPPAAAADPLTVTVTPSTGLRDGDEVRMTTDGIAPGAFVAHGQCDAVIFDETNPLATIFDHCTIDFGSMPDDGVVTRTVRETLVVGAARRPVHCGDSPGDCVVLLTTITQFGTAPIDVVPSPHAVAPTEVTTRERLHAWVGGDPGSAVAVAQCAEPAGATRADSSCTTDTVVTLDAGGRGEAVLAPVVSVPTPGSPADCRSLEPRGCAVASFGPDGVLVGSTPVTVTQADLATTVTPEPANDLVDGQETAVTVTSFAAEPMRIAQCAASVADTRTIEGGKCRAVEIFTPAPVSAPPARTVVPVTVAETFVADDGSAVDCMETWFACVIAVDTVATDDLTFGWGKIAFEHPPPSITVSDARGLLDGDPLTIELENWNPDNTGIFALCARFPATFDNLVADCTPVPEGPQFFVPDASGRASVTVPARQRFTTVFGEPRYCRDACRYVVFGVQPDVDVVYAMAGGRVSASPADRLDDGQTVMLTGRRLMASYDGAPVVGQPTGAWTAYQCAHAVTRDPSPTAVGQFCDVAGAVPVTVPASGEATASVTVHRVITPPGGPAVDCTRSERACRLVLFRLEQDGTSSLHEAPLNFRRARP